MLIIKCNKMRFPERLKARRRLRGLLRVLKAVLVIAIIAIAVIYFGI